MQKFNDEAKELAEKLYSKRNKLKNEVMERLKQASPDKDFATIEKEAEEIMKSPESLALWNSSQKPKPVGRFEKPKNKATSWKSK